MNRGNLFAEAVRFALALLVTVMCAACQAAATPPPPTATPVPPTPTPAPSLPPEARGYHLMAYDAESDRVILWSGCLSETECATGTWAYDPETNTWSDMTPAESPPLGHGPMAYDTESDRTVLYLDNVDRKCTCDPGIWGEMWAYDFNSNTWTNMGMTDGPPKVIGLKMAYDSESDRMILEGLQETWAYDYNTNTWTKMDPERHPPSPSWNVMAYDESSDRVILFGGPMGQDDTWAYDYNSDTWEELAPAQKPSGRLYADMVYDPVSERVILFGGECLPMCDDTWAYDYAANTWIDLAPEVHPSKRGWHAMVYSTGVERVILFGGGRNRFQYTAETWMYDPGANTWTNMTASP